MIRQGIDESTEFFNKRVADREAAGTPNWGVYVNRPAGIVEVIALGPGWRRQYGHMSLSSSWVYKDEADKEAERIGSKFR